MDTLVNITDTIDTYMYTYFLVFLLIFCGVFFTIRTRGVQFRYIKQMFKCITEKKHTSGEKSVSAFQALMVSTASRVGTGNIAGVATAIATGGPGAVFWMWLMALIGSASAFIESTLAQIWKVRGKEGEFRGGPAYYIQQALGKRWLGVLFAISLILCFALGFNGLQTYNMSSSLAYYIPGYNESMAPMALGILLAVLVGFCLFGGAHRISFLTSIIVPVMAIGYLLLALILTFMNITELPQVFGLIFSEAFDFHSIVGGFAGSMVVQGIKRGLFSNEAGMGSAPNAAASASVSHPV
jgi:AGCS family alanine or glycine:cation symporter